MFSNKPAFKPGGLYPGSGVAPGGQQGRPTAMHNGMTGTMSGGIAAGASRPRPRPPMLAMPAMKPRDIRQLMDALLATAPKPEKKG